MNRCFSSWWLTLILTLHLVGDSVSHFILSAHSPAHRSLFFMHLVFPNPFLPIQSCLPTTAPCRLERNPTRSSSTIKGTFPDRWSKRWTTAPLFWTSSTGGRFTPAGCWEAGGSSTSTPTTRAASTCWRRANTVNRQTGALSAPLCSLFEGLPSSWRHFACKLPLWLFFWVTHKRPERENSFSYNKNDNYDDHLRLIMTILRLSCSRYLHLAWA